MAAPLRRLPLSGRCWSSVLQHVVGVFPLHGVYSRAGGASPCACYVHQHVAADWRRRLQTRPSSVTGSAHQGERVVVPNCMGVSTAHTWEAAERLLQLAGGDAHAGDPPPEAAQQLQRIQVGEHGPRGQAEVLYLPWLHGGARLERQWESAGSTPAEGCVPCWVAPLHLMGTGRPRQSVLADN